MSYYFETKRFSNLKTAEQTMFLNICTIFSALHPCIGIKRFFKIFWRFLTFFIAGIWDGWRSCKAPSSISECRLILSSVSSSERLYFLIYFWTMSISVNSSLASLCFSFSVTFPVSSPLSLLWKCTFSCSQPFHLSWSVPWYSLLLHSAPSTHCKCGSTSLSQLH